MKSFKIMKILMVIGMASSMSADEKTLSRGPLVAGVLDENKTDGWLKKRVSKTI